MTNLLKTLTVFCLLSTTANASSQCSSIYGSDGNFVPKTVFKASDIIFSGSVKDKHDNVFGKSIKEDIYVEIGLSPNTYTSIAKLLVRILEDNGIYFSADLYHSKSVVKDGKIERLYTNDYVKLTIKDSIETGHREYVLTTRDTFKFTDRDNLAPRFKAESIKPFSGFAKQTIGSSKSLRFDLKKKGLDDLFIDMTLEGRAMELSLNATYLGENGGKIRVYETPRNYSNSEGLILVIREPAPDKSSEATTYEIRMHDHAPSYFATSK